MILLGLAGCGRSGSAQPVPQVVFARSLDAQKAARAIESTWDGASRSERLATEGAIVAFLHDYPKDPETLEMKLKLGWVRLAQGRLNDAQRLAEDPDISADGSIADSARILLAAVLRRQGEPLRALDLLRPLQGQLVDPDDCDAWGRETVLAALAARHFTEAIDSMTAWRLATSDESLLRTESTVSQLLERVPRVPLERALAQLSVERSAPTAVAARRQGREWMYEALRERLASDALRSADPDLARRLLREDPSHFHQPDTGARLSRLAATGPSQDVSAGRKLGLLLELKSATSRRRASELTAGVMGVLERGQDSKNVTFVSREAVTQEPMDVDAALDELGRDGVSLVVAGLTREAATIAARYGAEHSLGVILLVEPEQDVSSGAVFHMGVSDADLARAWRSEPDAPETGPEVTDQDPICQSSQEQVILPPSTKQTKVDVLFSASAECTRRVIDALGDRVRSLSLWLGPDAASAADELPVSIAGIVGAETWLADPNSESIRNWWRRFGRRPTWFEALGHDAALLAKRALISLPDHPATSHTEVVAMHGDAIVAIERAQGELWTSRQHGFDANRRIERVIGRRKLADVKGISEGR